MSNEQSGQAIGGTDIMIAAHAKSIDATLVTKNVKHFRLVKGLTSRTGPVSLKRPKLDASVCSVLPSITNK